LGTRGYVRAGLTYTHTLLSGAYVVHELRLATDPAPSEDACPLPLHPCELGTGRNLTQAPDGTWRNIYEEELITVSAAPILHSAPCVGYVIQEQPLPGKVDPKVYAPAIKKSGDHPSIMRQIQQGKTVTLSDGTVLSGPPKRPGRKIAVLGDTYDPSPIADLARNVDLLIHEATNAHLPGLDPETKIEDTFASVEERTKSRGHSTPQMAGAFARRVGAKRLVLNHFSARYRGDKEAIEAANADDLSIHLFDPDKSSQQVAKEEASASRESSVPPIAAEETTPEDPHELRLRKAAGVMRGIRALAVKAYGSTDVLCAHDFMSVTVEIVK
jgi:ribonuclease Z